jgi:ABC-type antimicrobial peptide transport system permease subunit
LSPQHSIAESLIKATAVFKKYALFGGTELRYAPADYAINFRNAKSLSRSIGLFTIIALSISCIGLFGISINAAEKRTKEMSIRKVLGAGAKTIALLLTKEFIKLVAVSIVIATPIALFLMEQLLRPISYRTTLSWWVPAVAGAVSFVIAFLTVGFQSVQVALTNPARHLRTE